MLLLLPPVGDLPLKPRAPPPCPGEQRALRCRSPGALGVPARRVLPGRLPGGCSPPKRGGERQAGAEASLGRPPSPGFPTVPAKAEFPPHACWGGSAPPGEAGSGLRTSVPGAERVWREDAGPPAERPSPSPPKTCRAITLGSRGSPPKANGGTLPLPESWPGGAPERESAGSGLVPQQKLPPACAGAGELGCAGGTPRPGRAAHPGPCLYVERRVI